MFPSPKSSEYCTLGMSLTLLILTMKDTVEFADVLLEEAVMLAVGAAKERVNEPLRLEDNSVFSSLQDSLQVYTPLGTLKSKSLQVYDVPAC